MKTLVRCICSASTCHFIIQLTYCYAAMLHLLDSSSDVMKKLSELGQQQPADNAEQADSEDQASKRLKVTDELRYCLYVFKIHILHLPLCSCHLSGISWLLICRSEFICVYATIVVTSIENIVVKM